MALGALVGQKPQIDLSQYVTETELNSKGYATQSWVTGQNYATQSWVNGRGYATQSWVNSQGFAKTSQIPDIPADFGIVSPGYFRSNNKVVQISEPTFEMNANYLMFIDFLSVPFMIWVAPNRLASNGNLTGLTYEGVRTAVSPSQTYSVTILLEREMINLVEQINVSLSCVPNRNEEFVAILYRLS